MIRAEPYHYPAKLLKVVDGDTIDVMLDLGFSVHIKRRVRLEGINTPERHGKYGLLAERAAQHLEMLLTEPGELYIVSRSLDKYGRVLGFVLHAGPPRNGGDELVWTDINSRMIKDGFALPYMGGKRDEDDFASLVQPNN